MKKLIEAVERGKVRGFEESRLVNNEPYLFQYALKKNADSYLAYLFFIPESKMDAVEDYGHEELKEFQLITEAVDYFTSVGVDLLKFKGIKRSLPF